MIYFFARNLTFPDKFYSTWAINAIRKISFGS